jgi:hypothetical protein
VGVTPTFKPESKASGNSGPYLLSAVLNNLLPLEIISKRLSNGSKKVSEEQLRIAIDNLESNPFVTALYD